MFPDLLSVTVLRDPVERTISHLRQIADLPQTSDDLEAIYEDPVWHARLRDHQVQVFAAAPQERPATREERQAYDPARYEEPERSRLRQLLLAAFTTAISEPQVIDEACLRRGGGPARPGGRGGRDRAARRGHGPGRVAGWVGNPRTSGGTTCRSGASTSRPGCGTGSSGRTAGTGCSTTGPWPAGGLTRDAG